MIVENLRNFFSIRANDLTSVQRTFTFHFNFNSFTWYIVRRQLNGVIKMLCVRARARFLCFFLLFGVSCCICMRQKCANLLSASWLHFWSCGVHEKNRLNSACTCHWITKCFELREFRNRKSTNINNVFMRLHFGCCCCCYFSWAIVFHLVSHLKVQGRNEKWAAAKTFFQYEEATQMSY